ncbi:MAG: hypothetical protein ACOCXH_13840, partial [Cyclobacteriaceae bacterium]
PNKVKNIPNVFFVVISMKVYFNPINLTTGAKCICFGQNPWCQIFNHQVAFTSEIDLSLSARKKKIF